MSSTQRSHSAPSGDRRAVSEAENVQSPGLLTAARWHTTRGRQSQPRTRSPGPSRDAGETTAQVAISVAHSNSSVATSETGQGSNHTAVTHSSGESSGDSPWTRKTLLTLDGGGVRGFSSLLILRALMMEIATLEQADSQAHSSAHPLKPRLRRPVRTQRNRADTLRRDQSPQQAQGPVFGPASASSSFLPAHYFDYIAGTSTGGLIAIMLGRLHMTVDECLEAYENMADFVFGHPRPLHIRKPPWIPVDKYDHRRLERIIKDIVKERSPSGHNSTEFRQPNENMCRTIVIAWQKLNITNTRIPHLFRSYYHPRSTEDDILERNPGSQGNYQIWQVCRATSAAPFYFKTVRLEEDDEKSEYIDGMLSAKLLSVYYKATKVPSVRLRQSCWLKSVVLLGGLGANNPTEEAYRSVKQLNNNNPRTVRVLVSIGTGKNLEADPNPSAGYRLYMAYANTAAKWATQSEATHHTMVDATRTFAEYFRLNVEHGIGKMKLDAWKGKKGCRTLELIRTKTQDYLDSPEGQRQISDSARHLVKVRRARSSSMYIDRWERFCHGVEYACHVPTCPDGRDKRYEDRQALRRHIQAFHAVSLNELESLLDDSKRFPEETDP